MGTARTKKDVETQEAEKMRRVIMEKSQDEAITMFSITENSKTENWSL